MASSVRDTAKTIWQAGVDAVDSERLVKNAVRFEDGQLHVGGESFPVTGNIGVVGCGKAGAGMGEGLLEGLHGFPRDIRGIVNVPADCVRPLDRIELVGARPAGVNLPTQAGVDATVRQLDLVSSLGADDVVIALISGGGSALLPAPPREIGLENKLIVTEALAAAGADITQLNTVRSALSLVKGGQFARAVKAGRVIALLISDVIGSPLGTIASGPFHVPETAVSPGEALEVLESLVSRGGPVPDSVYDFLTREQASWTDPGPLTTPVTHHIIGDNETAVKAAAKKAREFGFEVIETEHDVAGFATPEGERFAEVMRRAVQAGKPFCFISGGEPACPFDPNLGSKGGRNQQVALSFLAEIVDTAIPNVALISGGTDGEDAKTGTAGAIIDEAVRLAARSSKLSIKTHLKESNEHPFFEDCGNALLITGPTHTNVMDLRVLVFDPR